MVQRYWLVIFLFAIPAMLFGQDSDIKFSHLSLDDGLPANQVTDVLRDSRGFLWIATAAGLSRYDGREFKNFNNNQNDSTTLLSDHVNAMYEDPEKRLWLLTSRGMCVYDPVTERFSRDVSKVMNEYQVPLGHIQHAVTDSSGDFWVLSLYPGGLYKYSIDSRVTTQVTLFSNKVISDMSEGQNGNMWIVYRDGTFACLNNNLDSVYSNDELSRQYTDQRFHIISDMDGDLWIYSSTKNSGIYYFDAGKNSLRHVHKQSDGLRLNSDIVVDVEVDDSGRVWVATDHGGINLIDKNTWEIKYITNERYDARSLSDNTVSLLYRDRENIMWVGTNKQGLNYYHKDFSKFKLCQNSLVNAKSLPYNDINTFAEDKKGNLWIGTNGGGLIYFDRKNSTFKQYLHAPQNPSSIASNIIVSLFIDPLDRLWVGTYFGGLDYFDGQKFVHFQQKQSPDNQLSDNSIWDIAQDSEGNLWVATLQGFLNKYDPRTGKVYRYVQQDGIISRYVTSVLEDVDGSIWVATGYGLSILKKGGQKFTHILGGNKRGMLSSNHITWLYKDSKDVIWIGTYDGLNVYNRKTQTFQYVKAIDGLPNNEIRGIEEDELGRKWLITGKGIAALVIQNEDSPSDTLTAKILTFDEADGLQGKQFNRGAIIKTRDGHMFFGGTNGFNELDPAQLERSGGKPEVVMVKLFIDNDEVKIGENVNGRVILTKPITDTDNITLASGHNSFSLEFATLTFLHNARNRFRYKLIGFDKNWVEPEPGIRSARYTNIGHGKYELVIIAAGSDGSWNNEAAKLAVTILPPFWKSTTAFFLYVFLITAALLTARYLILKQERKKYLVEKETEETKRAIEMDRLKIKFITNVSHEFRTPLALILTPIESFLKQKEKNVVVAKDHLELIHRNAKRLLSMVNQLLDFRRLEVEEVKLNLTEGDMTSFVQELASTFSDLAEKKNIGFNVETGDEQVVTLFDPNKVERIVFNLLSNAFKFTPEGGNVLLKITTEEKDHLKYMKIEIKDTGIGIAPENLDKIFERFFQSDLPSHLVNQGSGIGLSISREFARLHGGDITVSSELNKGTCFTVTIPLRSQILTEPDVTALESETSQEQGSVKRKRNRILLVEDNEDFRFYLKDNLKYVYEIEEASNGTEGWKKAIDLMPDMIVSDIMMPGMNGIELCSKVKADNRTSHIPLILLTARSSEEMRLEGFKTGADDYIVKPFNFEILHARIRNLVSLRAKFHKKFQQNVQIKASEITIAPLDEIFIAKAVKLVEDNISDSEFSVEELSKELGVSRGHLYRKLFALTGKSAVEFIRVIKLQRAAQLLEKSQLTVAEIAYKVGFNSPKYFSRYFKEQYKVLPSVYANRKGEPPALEDSNLPNG